MLTHRTISQTFSSETIEESFLEFFHRLGYAILPGSSLLDESVKMSFVMSAGLVQVERALRGGNHLSQRHFGLVQSCFRHFDLLDSVGSSDLHLSFFRMTGMFNFAPIEQRARIVEIGELLFNVFHLSPDLLWATFFSGGKVQGYSFDADLQTRQSWLDVGFRSDHIVALQDNIWQQSPLMGPAGNLKIGPISEVFWDRGAQLACGSGCLPGCRCGRFVEFLNTLFIGWERDMAAHQLRPLSEPFVEIVIGVERLAMVLQGVNSVYEVESLPLLLSTLKKFIGEKTICGVEQERQMRLFADHLRALLFLVADGAPPPGRGGQERIMRRLVRNLLTAQKLLDLPVEKSNRLSPVIVTMLDNLIGFYQSEHPILGQLQPRMIVAHPNLLHSPTKLIDYLTREAELFEQTLQRGLHRMERMLHSHPNQFLSGQEMLELEVSEGVPSVYLASILDKQSVGYSWAEYRSARRHWQESNAAKKEETFA